MSHHTNLFESQSQNDPITNLPIGFHTDIHQRIESFYKYHEIQPNWTEIVHSKHNNEIIEFFNKNESDMLCSGSWYLKDLIATNNIESLNYILSKTKSFHINTPSTYSCGKFKNFTPIQFACSQSNFDSIKLLLSKGSDVKHESNHRIINLLFQHNKCIDELNIIPCIHHLVSLGCPVPKDSIYYLIKHSKTNNNELNELKSETYFDRVSLSEFLYTHGADINYIATALDKQYFDLAQMFIDNGAHLDDNMLRYIRQKHSFIWLFSNGYIGDINYNNKYNGTALFYHTQHNNYNAIQVLLSYGADVNIRCKHSQLTAIEIAMFSNYKNIVQLLYKPNKYQLTPALLQNIMKNNFEMLPSDPQQLKQILIEYHNDQKDNEYKSEILDDYNNSEIETEYNKIDTNINNLLKELKNEYDKLIKIQCVRNKNKQSMNYNRNKLKLWDDFEALWIYWDIKSFIEWLKRIKYKYVKSFYGYWKTDKQCIDKIEQYIQSNPNRFHIIINQNKNQSFFKCNDITEKLIITSPSKIKSKSQSILVANKRKKFLDGLNLGSSRSYPIIKGNDNNECDMEEDKQEEKDIINKERMNDVFKGAYLEYFDRYILDKIGIMNELDLDIVFNEIVRLRRKYPNLNNQIENEQNDDIGHDNRQCNVCCDRETTHVLQCGHSFCEFCIDEFQKTTNRCAICKGKITLVIKMY